MAEGAGVITEEGDFAGVGAGRVPAGDAGLVDLASAVGFGVIVGRVRVVGFGVAAGADVMGADGGVVAGVTVPGCGGLTSR